MKKLLIFSLLLLLGVQTACLRVPPRCKIPNCYVAVDHNHAIGSETRANGDTKDVGKVFRGTPYFSYIFRKKYKAQESKGYYRKIDGREAYDKRQTSKSQVQPKSKSKPKPKPKPPATKE